MGKANPRFTTGACKAVPLAPCTLFHLRRKVARDATEMFRLFMLYSYSNIPGPMSRGEPSLDDENQKANDDWRVGTPYQGGTGKAFSGMARVACRSKTALTMNESDHQYNGRSSPVQLFGCGIWLHSLDGKGRITLI